MTQFLDHDGTALAYERLPGQNPTVVFLPGFKSDMLGSKAEAVLAHCQTKRQAQGQGQAHGQAVLRFDYSGHGQSQGRFEDGTIGRWLTDTLRVLDALTTGPLVLVGSSMGGWLALLAALARPTRVQALLLIAPAPDFTAWGIEAHLTAADRKMLNEQGMIIQPSEYGPKPYCITKALIEDGRLHLLLGRPIEFAGPVRILQGQQDSDVPWQTAITLMQQLRSPDVRVQLIKDGDHRLSRPQDIALLCQTLDELIALAL